MSREESAGKKQAGEAFAEMFRAFGEAVSEMFDDPDLKEKAREFGRSAVKSAETFGSRFKDEDVRARFREVGKAAQEFGKAVADRFRADKGTSNRDGKTGTNP